jgi:hypothetical protein
MAYKLKKDHVTNWDMQASDEKPIYNDDQETYISERSSTVPSPVHTPVPSPKIKRSPTPPPYVPPKESHTLRYHYNELPENGIPLATQVNQAKKEEKKRQKNVRRAPPGQGNLAPFPDTTEPIVGENYYPYWRAYQEKNPDYIMRHRQTADGQIIPYDTVDPSQYIPESVVTDSTAKPRRHHRKSRRHHDRSTKQSKPDKFIEKVSPPIQYTSLKDPDNEEHSDRRTSQDSKSLNNNSPNENKKHHHHHHHHNPSRLHHHHHHQHHHHIHQHSPPIKEFVDTEFRVIDASFKKNERSSYFQEKQNPTHSPPPALYHQNSFLPPITRDYYHRPSLNDYYGTQTFHRDWKSSIDSPKIYKADPQTNFYERYLNNVIDKRLTT